MTEGSGGNDREDLREYQRGQSMHAKGPRVGVPEGLHYVEKWFINPCNKLNADFSR